MLKERFTFIDGLRGIASLGVVIFHSVEGNHVDNLPVAIRHIASLGASGVPVFFVISGFVIAHSLRDQKMSFQSMGRFVVKRSIRLDPPYWAAIALAIGFSLLASRMVSGRSVDQFTSGQLAAHVFYLQNILGFQNINPIFWTLCYEVQFYLVFAGLLFFRSRWTLVAAFMVSLLWCFRLVPPIQGLFPNLWYAFLLGAGTWYAWQRKLAAPAFPAYVILVFGAAVITADSFAMICCAAACAILFAAEYDHLSDWLNWRWLQFLGTISYSLYLVHNPITGAVFRIGYLVWPPGLLPTVVWWAVSVLTCIIAATVLYLSVERPCMRLAQSLQTRRMISTPPARYKADTV